MQLNFSVENQRLKLESNERLVERSSHYIKAAFSFGEDWTNLNKVALFLPLGETLPIPVIIDASGVCSVPEKVAYRGGQSRLSVIGCNSATLERILNGESASLDDVIITTNPVRLSFEATINYEALSEDEDISSLFIDFIRQINGIAQEVENLKVKGYDDTEIREILAGKAEKSEVENAYNFAVDNANDIHTLRETISSDYVKKTDYATNEKAGVVKINPYFGLKMREDGTLAIDKATEAKIAERKDNYRPITPSSIEYAVKSVGDGYYATVEDLGDVDAALESILALQSGYIGGEDV